MQYPIACEHTRACENAVSHVTEQFWLFIVLSDTRRHSRHVGVALRRIAHKPRTNPSQMVCTGRLFFRSLSAFCRLLIEIFNHRQTCYWYVKLEYQFHVIIAVHLHWCWNNLKVKECVSITRLKDCKSLRLSNPDKL